MEACSERIVLYMHEYLDEDIPEDHKKILEYHLETCRACRQHFYELQKSIFYVQSLPNVQAPPGFTGRIMKNLPREKKRIGAGRWLKMHPFLASAGLFFILMAGAMFSEWHNPDEFSVTKNKDIIVQGHTAIVPKGKVIKEDITVTNGDLRIEGKVEGNVTVVRGNEYMASAGDVTGNVEEINEVFEWIWYKIKDAGRDAWKHLK